MPSNRFIFLQVTGIFLLGTTLALARQLPPGEMTDKELEQVRQGAVSVNARVDSADLEETIRAAIVIDAPAEKIWAVMNDCNRTPLFIPGLKACRVLEQDAEGEVIQHRFRYSWFLPEVTYTFRAHYEKFRKISFRRMAGDLKEFRGNWTLTAWEDSRKTLVVYSVFIDPGFFIPRRVVRYLLRRDLPDLMTALREEVLASGP